MGREDSILCCVSCDSVICEITKYKVDKKGMLDVPSKNIVNTKIVCQIEDKDHKNLACSCGESLGEAIHMKKGWKYLLDSKKIIRSMIDGEEKMEDGQSQVQSSSGKQASSKKTGKESASCSCKNSAEFVEMKNRLEKLEQQMNSMKMDNVIKFKDMSKMLIMYKLEILRLQEIVWSLHPNVDLSSAFVVDNNAISMTLKSIEDSFEQ